MIWYIMSGILILIAMSIMVAQYIRDRRYMKKRTSGAMSDELWNEIQNERESSKERKEKFRSALKQAQSHSKQE